MADSSMAIVTGASRGIGRAVAVALGRAGFAVVVNYVRHAEAADDVVAQICQEGGRAVAVAASVADADQRRELLDRAQQAFGDLQVLVNNAGITSPGRLDILDATEHNWDIVFDTNLKGPFFLTQQAAHCMLNARRAGRLARGVIVNVSSISAFAVSTNRADYCLTKAALRMMTQLFAVRLADEGINVYEVCPGIVATDMTAPVKDKYDRLIADGLTPIRRWGQPEDVAAAVVSLARGDFPFSTGDCIHVDGGFHIQRL
ncbi:MAG: 3-ketoacyl-ACP reductase [Planctomycetaceae bacterium]|nr:3-ketoacyl-ACP reductase [Planctomycetaceae bacterium]